VDYSAPAADNLAAACVNGVHARPRSTPARPAGRRRPQAVHSRRVATTSRNATCPQRPQHLWLWREPHEWHEAPTTMARAPSSRLPPTRRWRSWRWCVCLWCQSPAGT